jgi:hypothetical protein
MFRNQIRDAGQILGKDFSSEIRIRFLATCNVISLHRPGALAKLKDELSKYGVAIAAVQEIRWCGCEIF